MKEKYEGAEMEIVYFENADVITSSGGEEPIESFSLDIEDGTSDGTESGISANYYKPF